MFDNAKLVVVSMITIYCYCYCWTNNLLLELLFSPGYSPGPTGAPQACIPPNTYPYNIYSPKNWSNKINTPHKSNLIYVPSKQLVAKHHLFTEYNQAESQKKQLSQQQVYIGESCYFVFPMCLSVSHVFFNAFWMHFDLSNEPIEPMMLEPLVHWVWSK